MDENKDKNTPVNMGKDKANKPLAVPAYTKDQLSNLTTAQIQIIKESADSDANRPPFQDYFAHLFRDYLAHHSEMISPTIPR